MRTILVASDLSERSDRAMARGLVLGQQYGLAVKIIHVVDEALPPSLAKSVCTYAQLHLDNQLAAAGTAPAVRASAQVLVDHDYPAILRVADEEDAEVIILGCHRQPGSGARAIGSVAERVIRHGHRPVLVVKNEPQAAYHKVLVCVDFSVQSHRAMYYAADFVPEGYFHFVHAYQIPFHAFLRGRTTHAQVRSQHEERMRAVVQRQMEAFGTGAVPFHAQAERIIEEGPAIEVIRRQAARIKPDLLVAGTHGRTGVAHMLLGSVAEELLLDPPCDLLLVKGW